MGKVYDQIDDKLTAFIEAQKMYFVATARLSGEGTDGLTGMERPK